MNIVHNSVDIVNAAATAIGTAETRHQPSTVLQKRRWGSWLSLFGCFGSYKNHNRVGHAVQISEPKAEEMAAPVAESLNLRNPIVLPFIAPPSSPASFLQSDPPSATQSPGGLLSLTSLSVSYSLGGTASIFTIGPYAHDTQLVTPPAFSAFPTEPSTAPFTPPPEPVQLTTPPSPEVPFAQLLASSLARPRSNFGMNQKFLLTSYEFQPCPDSPGANLISPASVISNSGAASPLLGKHTINQLRMEGHSKLFGYEHFSTDRGVTMLGSGSITPNDCDSRLASGTLTPNGCSTSRLGFENLMPNGAEHFSQDRFILANRISEVASLANSDNELPSDEHTINCRVSFELTSEHVPGCAVDKAVLSCETVSASVQNLASKGTSSNNTISNKSDCFCQNCIREALGKPEKSIDELQCHCRLQRDKMEPSKDFNFDRTKKEVIDKPTISSEWWSREKAATVEMVSQRNWSFFPMLQAGIS